MKKRKLRKSETVLITMLVLIVGLTFSIDSKFKRTKRSNRAMQQQVKNPVQALNPPDDNRISEKSGVQSADFISSWGLDPFDRPFTAVMDISAEGAPASEGAAKYKLYGVIFASGGAAALIDKKACSVGDTIHHYLVESITKDEVVIRSYLDGSKRKLRVE